MTSEELSYLAGIIDGEGSIGLYKTTSSPNDRHSISLRLQIANTSRPMLDWVLSKTGIGSIRNKEACSLTRRQAWVWSATSKQAVEIIRQIRPYLIIKAPQADVVIALWELERSLGVKQGTKPSPELQAFRFQAAIKVKELKKTA